MRVIKFPILTITISFAFGILINYFIKLQFYTLLILLLFLLVNFSFAFFRSGKIVFQNIYFGISCYFLVFSMGALTHYLHTEINYKNHYSKKITDNKNEIIGTVSAIIKPNNSYDKYILTVDECNAQKTIGKILLYYKKSDKNKLRIGDKIWIYKEIKPATQSFNPYQFDYSKYLEKQNIYHQIYCYKKDIVKVGVTKNFDFYLQKLRDKLLYSFSKHNYTVTQKSILEALLFGQKTMMDKETVTNYSKAGVIHILAISGLHIGIIYFFLAFVFKPLDRFKQGKFFKLILIISLLWIFALITGLPASVTRAVTLFTFISIGKYFKQQNNIYNAVAVSALLLLIFNPNFLFDVGFQLSYAAVISILLFQPFYKKFYFTKNKIGIYFVDIVLVSLAAQIGVLPLSLYYFNQLPLLFLVANIVVIPLASFVLIVGSITLLLNFILPPVALLLGRFISWAIDGMNGYIAFISKLEIGIIENISFTGLLAIAMYIVLIAFIYWLYTRKWNAFRNTILALLLFQIVFMITKWKENNTNELIVFNSKNTLVTIKNDNKVTMLTNELNNNSNLVKDYTRGTFSSNAVVSSLRNCISFNSKRVLIIDSLSVYKTTLKPEIVLLTQGTKVNLERLIKEINPRIIVVDNSNPFYKIRQWKLTCEKEKIPFHATAEKGLYRLK